MTIYNQTVGHSKLISKYYNTKKTKVSLSTTSRHAVSSWPLPSEFWLGRHRERTCGGELQRVQKQFPNCLHLFTPKCDEKLKPKVGMAFQ
ncbi:hypothetical protein BRADI_3g34618v3 [Brachypodium distachyon]|uniref:Uncharacterized protein n=1 Tax=Brachypodium distachyon TaxID=15368 RepID=A0A2K2D127_BRADI|nr:hypothetical protein BRADI_3g34618v3 [Brachypodium distachyon]